jgi:hypothetical protein
MTVAAVEAMMVVQGGQGGASRGGIDEVGARYVHQIRDLGVHVLYGDAEVDRMLISLAARGATDFDGSSPEETFVQLHSTRTTNATVYEEYLHVLEGQKRGWRSVPDHQARLMEEVEVAAMVLAQAEALHLTPELVDELSKIRQSYLEELWDTYHIRYP